MLCAASTIVQCLNSAQGAYNHIIMTGIRDNLCLFKLISQVTSATTMPQLTMIEVVEVNVAEVEVAVDVVDVAILVSPT